MNSANLEKVLVVAAGVIAAGVLIAWARGSNIPLLGDVAAMAHDGFDG